MICELCRLFMIIIRVVWWRRLSCLEPDASVTHTCLWDCEWWVDSQAMTFISVTDVLVDSMWVYLSDEYFKVTSGREFGNCFDLKHAFCKTVRIRQYVTIGDTLVCQISMPNAIGEWMCTCKTGPWFNTNSIVTAAIHNLVKVWTRSSFVTGQECDV